MPGFNSKGPLGKGPMTGRGLGRCKSRNKRRFATNTSDDENTENNILKRRGLRRRLGSAFGSLRRES